jgi:outer membrane lipoprotein LolB
VKPDLRVFLILLIPLALAACVPAGVRGDAATLRAQAAREKRMAPHTHWLIKARLAVSDGKHGGSGSLTWRQEGESYDFTLRAPVTGRSFRLHGGPDGAVLDGLDRGQMRGPDAQHLLARALGWRVPLAQLSDWVRGMRAPGAPATVRFGSNHLLSKLVQDGWTVKYLDWYDRQQLPLPRRVFASRGPYRVRVSIQSWSLQ